MKEKSILRQNRNKILCFLLTLLLAGFTINAVLKGSGISLDDLWDSLRRASLPGILCAIVSMLGFIYFEGEALRVIVRHMGYPTKRSKGFVYASADVYFSAITPSASGGQPASAYFMVQDGIPGTVIMTSLLLNLIMYTLAIVTIGLLNVIVYPNIFLHFRLESQLLIVFGALVLLGLAVLFYLLLRKQSIVRHAGFGFAAFLRKLHMKKLARRIERKLAASLEKYAQCAESVFTGKKMLLQAYFLNLLQRLSQIAVTLFAYAAMHGELSKLPKLLATQIYVVLGSNCVPIPGGVGVTDYLMLQGYRQLMDKVDAYQLEILSRGLSFYVCILVSMITVVIAYLNHKRKKNLERKK